MKSSAYSNPKNWDWMLSSNANGSGSKISSCKMTELVMQPYNSKLVVAAAFGRISVYDPTSLSTGTVVPISDDLTFWENIEVERTFTVKCVDDKNLYIYVVDGIPLSRPYMG
jgi:hypothetical protein